MLPLLQLCDLYENDCIFDKFECAVSGDASNVLTGSYNNMCHMYDRYGQTKGSLEVSEILPGTAYVRCAAELVVA